MFPNVLLPIVLLVSFLTPPAQPADLAQPRTSAPALHLSVAGPSPTAATVKTVVPAAVTSAASTPLHTGDASSDKPKRSREYRAAHSNKAKDWKGYQPSLYRGKFYRASQEAFRKCVGYREGKFIYRVIGGSGDNYYGTYQISYKFQKGVSGRWGTPGNMATESKQTNDGLRKIAWKLLHKPINRWSRYWQDRAFFTILNWEGDWKGKHHWGGGSHAC